MSKPPVNLSNLRRLAILMPNWLGDAVMAEPSIRAINLAAPSLELSLFGKPSAVSMLEGHPAISSIVGINDKGIFGPLKSGRALQADDADAVLLLRNSFRSGLGAAVSRIRPRIGFARDARQALLTHPTTPPAGDRPFPTVDFYATLVESAFGISVDDRLPRLVTTPSEQAAAPNCWPTSRDRSWHSCRWKQVEETLAFGSIRRSRSSTRFDRKRCGPPGRSRRAGPSLRT